MHAYLVQCAKSNRTGLPFQQMKTNFNENEKALYMMLSYNRVK